MGKEKKNSNLKVIAFKLPEDQVNSIKNLCNQGFYPSLSETVRIAITDYISHVIDITTQNKSEYWLSIADQDALSGLSNVKQNKISACTKMPYELLKTIDKIISLNQQSFTNRTNFIRLAIKKFLEKDSEIYSYWLQGSKKGVQMESNSSSRREQIHSTS